MFYQKLRTRFLNKMKFDFRRTLAGFFINFLHNFFYGRKVCRKKLHSGVNGLIHVEFDRDDFEKLVEVEIQYNKNMVSFSN